MAYADQGMSRNRMVALGIVGLLHVGLGYAFITGLALKAVKAIVNPIEAANIEEETPPPEEPPPPPPKELEIPPYVPPPEVSVQTDAPPPPTISTSQVPQPAPPVFTPPAPPAPPAPAAVAPPTPPTDRGRGNTISREDYPDASVRAEEQGVARVSLTVAPDGRVSACSVTQSSGFPRLDEATCRIIQRRWRYNPGTRDGKPVDATVTKQVRWRLEEQR